MKPKPNWLLRFCIGLLALAFLCLALTPVVIRYGLKQRLGPERYAELRAFFDDPVSVPEEWREPKEFPADLVEAASQDIEFRNHQDIPHELNKLLFDISNGDTQLTPDVIYRIGPYLRELEKYLVSFSKIVSHPDYEISIWETLGNDRPGKSIIRFSELCRHAAIFSRVCAASGECETALEMALPFVRLAKEEAPVSLMSRMISTVCLSITIASMEKTLSKCPDDHSLEKILKELSSISAFDQIPKGMEMVFEDDVAIINKSGSSRDASLLGREDPRADFHQRATQIEIQQSPLAYAFMEPRYVTEMRRPPLLYIARLLAIDELLCVVNDHQMFLQKDGGLRKDFVRTRIHFDLLRLNIANRILEARGQEKATSASELVPEFFEEELVHPDTGVAYEWDAEAGEFVYEEAE